MTLDRIDFVPGSFDSVALSADSFDYSSALSAVAVSTRRPLICLRQLPLPINSFEVSVSPLFVLDIALAYSNSDSKSY